MNQNYFEGVENILKKGGEISPFLFLSSNLEILHADMQGFILQLLSENNIDAQSLFHLQDLGEALKIGEVKVFLAQGNVRPRFMFQVFFIENISRMTLQAQNACLKFFEEPGEGNIVFLSSNSESGILETILSRVQIQQFSKPSLEKRNESINSFYMSMLESHASKQSDELVQYFFSGKYEKDEYVDLLKTIIHYIEKTSNFTHLLDELHEDIGGILKNNLQGRYVVDKYVMLLGS